MRSLRAAAILAVFFVVTLFMIPVQGTAVKLRLRARKGLAQRYHRFLCRLLGIKVTVIGTPLQDRGVLMAANHSSYLDIIVLSAVARVSFVARGDVAGWPFFGTLARLQETVFVDRARRSRAMADRDQIRDRLRRGDALVLFPEGTSSDGNRVLPFKSALMSAAERDVAPESGPERHVPVQPVSLAYVGLYGIPMGRENRPFFAWYGDMDLIPHLWEAFEMGPIDVVVEFHAPLTIDEVGGRKALARAAEEASRAGVIRALAGRHVVPALAGPPEDEAGAEAAEAA